MENFSIFIKELRNATSQRGIKYFHLFWAQGFNYDIDP